MTERLVDCRQPTPFIGREQAGQLLADEIAKLEVRDPVVLALPRGGVPVAAVIARRLGAPLDLVLVRKIGAPGQPEYAAAAIVDGSAAETVINEETVGTAGLDERYLAKASALARKEIERRRALYLAGRKPVPVTGRDVIVVDDGIATGTTVRAALRALSRKSPRRLILAVPVVAPSIAADLAREVDLLIALAMPRRFGSVGACFDDFHQLDDDEVIALLASVN